MQFNVIFSCKSIREYWELGSGKITLNNNENV